MGRRIEKSRKISNDREGKARTPKNIVLMALEGNNKTEKNYFNNFGDRKKTYNIRFTDGNDTDPLNLVQQLIEEIEKQELDLQDGDVAFCIFDTDTNPVKDKIINEAVQLAEKNNIKIITSAPCVELWFLLHYEYTTANMNSKEVIKKLKKSYPKYEKNVDIYSDIIGNLDEAIKRAKQLEKYQLDNNRRIGTVSANPNTEVYKIVEYLINKG